MSNQKKMRNRFSIVFLSVLAVIACLWSACAGDVTNTGQSVLDKEDAVIVLVDTFKLSSHIDSCDAIISQADSFLLGEIETDYGVLRASILSQLACPEGYSYPEGFHVDSIDSICLFINYATWVGNASSPMAINVYMMDKKTFRYSSTYPTNLNISDYCTREKSILTNRRIVVAEEMRDSIKNSSGVYIPVIRMRVNDDFTDYFGSIQKFESQEQFNEAFKGLLIESSFGSSTILNITDIALGVYYRFGYKKSGRDTVVHDMKAFYANSEVRTVNHLEYEDKAEWVESLKKDSDTYNYIIAPAGVYTRMNIPMQQIAEAIFSDMAVSVDDTTYLLKRPYVNKAEIRVSVQNKYEGAEGKEGRNDWLQPAQYMLLVKESSMKRFFADKELPSDTCALLSALTQSTDSLGNNIYYYSYDLSDFITNQLRKESNDSILRMLLVPVAVGTSYTSTSSTAITSVSQQQTLSATQILSAKNGMELEIVYSGF